jgi:hypothetical protein
MICLVVGKSTKREIGKTISRLQFTLSEIEFCAMGEKPIAPKRHSSTIGFLALFLSLQQEIIADRTLQPRER